MNCAERAVDAQHRAAQDDEAGAGKLGRGLEIHARLDAGDLEMLLRGGRRSCAGLPQRRISTLSASSAPSGTSAQRQVGNRHEQVAQRGVVGLGGFSLRLRDLGLLLGDEGAQALEFRARRPRPWRRRPAWRRRSGRPGRSRRRGSLARRDSSSARISATSGAEIPRRPRAASKAAGFSRMARMSCMSSHLGCCRPDMPDCGPGGKQSGARGGNGLKRLRKAESDLGPIGARFAPDGGQGAPGGASESGRGGRASRPHPVTARRRPPARAPARVRASGCRHVGAGETRSSCWLLARRRPQGDGGDGRGKSRWTRTRHRRSAAAPAPRLACASAALPSPGPAARVRANLRASGRQDPGPRVMPRREAPDNERTTHVRNPRLRPGRLAVPAPPAPSPASCR